MIVQKQLLSGKMIDLMRPKVEDVTFKDLATPLMNIKRFTGHTTSPVDVLRHSLAVSHLVANPESVPYAIVHDFHEVFINDMDTPLKQLLVALGGRQVEAAIRKADSMWTACVWEAMGLDAPPDWVLEDVKRADIVTLMIERREFMNAPTEPWHPDLEAIELTDQVPPCYGWGDEYAIRQLKEYIFKFCPNHWRGFFK